MPTIQDIKAELNDLTTLRFISSAFTEASAARIKNIREAFERNRSFFEEISYVYHLVKISAIKYKEQHKDKKVELAEGNGKSLFVALTSNQRFYGNLNINIIKKFLSDSEKETSCDLLVIGQTGKDYISSQHTGRKYRTMMFSKERPELEEIKKFLDMVSAYSKVVLYYPKFVTLLTQTVGSIDITQSENVTAKDKDAEIRIIFEPELNKMLDFFEHQIRSLLFLRVLLETDLSRTAARLISMSAAEERATEMMKEKKQQLNKVTKSFINARLLETFAAMSKWSK